jgi:hypothetical protein
LQTGDAAKLFSVAHNIGSSALGLPGANFNVGGPGTGAANTVVALSYDETSRRVDDIKKQFLLEHDHPQRERLLAEIDQRTAEWDRRNGENGDGE